MFLQSAHRIRMVGYRRSKQRGSRYVGTSQTRSNRALNLLDFELIWQDEVCIVEEMLVDLHDFLTDVQMAIVAHYRIQNYMRLELRIIEQSCHAPPSNPTTYPRKMNQALSRPSTSDPLR